MLDMVSWAAAVLELALPEPVALAVPTLALALRTDWLQEVEAVEPQPSSAASAVEEARGLAVQSLVV